MGGRVPGGGVARAEQAAREARFFYSAVASDRFTCSSIKEKQRGGYYDDKKIVFFRHNGCSVCALWMRDLCYGKISIFRFVREACENEASQAGAFENLVAAHVKCK